MSTNIYPNRSGFLEVDVTDEMRESAEKRNESFFKKFGHAGTHRTNKKRQRMTGYVAEMAVKAAFPNFEFSGDHAIDFVVGKTTIDVKAQGCNTSPAPDFVGTLYEEQRDRPVDYYIFTRVCNDFSKVWITGIISRKDFLRTARLIPAGTANNNFTYDQSRYEMEYRKMTPAAKLFKGDKNAK